MIANPTSASSSCIQGGLDPRRPAFARACRPPGEMGHAYLQAQFVGYLALVADRYRGPAPSSGPVRRRLGPPRDRRRRAGSLRNRSRGRGFPAPPSGNSSETRLRRRPLQPAQPSGRTKLSPTRSRSPTSRAAHVTSGGPGVVSGRTPGMRSLVPEKQSANVSIRAAAGYPMMAHSSAMSASPTAWKLVTAAYPALATAGSPTRLLLRLTGLLTKIPPTAGFFPLQDATPFVHHRCITRSALRTRKAPESSP